MNLDEAIKPDSMRPVLNDVFKVVAGVAVRVALYALAVGALCLASVIRVMGLWTAPGTGTLTLVLLACTAVLAGWALRRAERLRYEPSFCPPLAYMHVVERLPNGNIVLAKLADGGEI